MRRTVYLIAAATVLGGCGREPISTQASVQGRQLIATTSRAPATAELEDLATLRRVTAPFHRFETAKNAGWSAKITECMESPEGGMGLHYGNPALIDGIARVDEPEVLLYEPEANGRLRLVAVEYIVPYTAHSRSAAPPVLFGREFKQNDAFQLWGLHAWVWSDNPSGMFADWNPRVTCDHATALSAMTHD